MCRCGLLNKVSSLESLDRTCGVPSSGIAGLEDASVQSAVDALYSLLFAMVLQGRAWYRAQESVWLQALPAFERVAEPSRRAACVAAVGRRVSHAYKVRSYCCAHGRSADLWL